jgi:hypothetical protein
LAVVETVTQGELAQQLGNASQGKVTLAGGMNLPGPEAVQIYPWPGARADRGPRLSQPRGGRCRGPRRPIGAGCRSLSGAHRPTGPGHPRIAGGVLQPGPARRQHLHVVARRAPAWPHGPSGAVG